MKSILFVDDEPFILSSISRMMRKERKRWNADYANGGEEALEKIRSETYDLLVTDMKMPVVDGMEVLRTAEELYPKMPRIALSGYSEKETDARTKKLAQTFLDKPCDSNKLKKTIELFIGDS
ncbi:response regulator [Puniceicoccaceae bacterium K14]|nr:response regulator [Puniceicoccaceae bacterium K14]